MELRMSIAEQALFKSFLTCAKSYLEFGAGGSTVLASKTVCGPVCTIESNQEWIDNVQFFLQPADFERTFIFADVGPTGDWGTPINNHGQVNYFNYHTNVWEKITHTYDLFLVDGRFRVACFCQCLLRSSPSSIIGVHDYRSRRGYQVIEGIAEPIAEVQDLTFFRRAHNVSSADVSSLLVRYSLNVA